MTPILRSIGLRAGEAGYRSTLRTGDDAVFEIVYDTEDLALDYAVLAISSPAGDRVCTVGTHLSPAFADVLHGKGVLECRLPALPLAEGEYSVVITLGTRTPSRSVDEVQDALRFAVELGDYFATGRTLLRGQGFVAQRSEWRVVR